jgi:hypothetical protein
MGQKYRLDGRFTVKEGAEGQLSLVFETGPGPMVILELPASMDMEEAQKIAKALTPVADVVVDFNYSPAAKLGYGPERPSRVRQTRRGVKVPRKPK